MLEKIEKINSLLIEGTIEKPIIDTKLSDKEIRDSFNKEWPIEVVEKQKSVDVLYYSFDNKIHQGQLIINKELEKDIYEIFEFARKIKFPIEKIVPISVYNWDDDISMKNNNTSGFNYRKILGSEKLSTHALGFAIDINPLLNPMIEDGKVFPDCTNYDQGKIGTLNLKHLIVKKFKELGWSWGGDWQSIKDYQHFEKILEEPR